MSSIGVTVDRVSKTYVTPDGRETEALATTSFQLSPGEFVTLVGPSGCGKTTLLKICAGLIRPSTGGVSSSASGERMRPGDSGMVFQAPGLLPWRTTLDNVLLPADILGMNRQSAKERALDLLDLVQLSSATRHYPNELSGGMQQRAAIARALLHDPGILFMDEPFAALDAMTREDLNMELQRLHHSQGKTVLFVTHGISEAVLMSDRVLVMSASPGRIVEEIRIDAPRPRRPAQFLLSDDARTAEANIRGAMDKYGAASR